MYREISVNLRAVILMITTLDSTSILNMQKHLYQSLQTSSRIV